MSERRYTSNAGALLLIDALRDHVQHVMRASGTPGLNLALALDGALIWEAGFGFADLARARPVTPDTVYRSGSLGKTYTGTAIMILVDRGVLKLEDPINRHLPFGVRNPLGARDITVQDLLTHRAGLGTDAALSLLTVPRPLAVEVEAEYGKAQSPITGGTMPRWAAPVGEAWCYSNLGIATLGLIVEHANLQKLSFPEFVQQNVMDPLGMTLAQYPPAQDAAHARAEVWDHASTGYARMGNACIPTLPVFFGEYPAGGVLQCPRDHLRLLLAMMNGGELDGRRILSQASVAAMLKPASADPLVPTPINVDGVAHQGLIWRLNDQASSLPSFDHGGGHMYGWRTQGRAWPSRRAALVVGSNQWSLPDDSIEVDQVAGFVGQWFKYRPAMPVPERDAEWPKTLSYVRGAVFAAAYVTMVGIPGSLPPEAIERCIADTRMRPGGEDDWDPEAFRAGIGDFEAHGTDIEHARAFWTSRACRVVPPRLHHALAALEVRTPSFLAAILPAATGP